MSLFLHFLFCVASVPVLSVLLRLLFGLKIIGLTGGIACGKSTVVRCWQRLGANVIDFDIISRNVVLPGQPAWHEIRKEFGVMVFNYDNTLDRKKLGDVVFGNRERLNTLNRIMAFYILFAFVNEFFAHFFIKMNRVIVLDVCLF